MELNGTARSCPPGWPCRIPTAACRSQGGSLVRWLPCCRGPITRSCMQLLDAIICSGAGSLLHAI